MDLEDNIETTRRVRRLEERFKRLNILGGSGVQVEGDVTKGYAVDTSQLGAEAIVEIIGGILIGACCIGEACSLTTESDCIASGGAFLGAGTVCSPNPCLVVLPSCSTCYFTNSCFGDGKRWLTKTCVTSRYAIGNFDYDGDTQWEQGTFSQTRSYVPGSCTEDNSGCEGSGHIHMPFIGPPYNEPGGDCDYSGCAPPVGCVIEGYGEISLGRGTSDACVDLGPGCDIGDFYCASCGGGITSCSSDFQESYYTVAWPCCDGSCANTSGYVIYDVYYSDECSP